MAGSCYSLCAGSVQRLMGAFFPICLGSRGRCFWLTSDRHNGSSYNWSYGNLYCFEAIL